MTEIVGVTMQVEKEEKKKNIYFLN